MAEKTLPPGNRCRLCGERIFWLRTGSNKAIPINAAADPEGNITVFTDAGRCSPVAVVHSKANPPPEEATRYRSHFATCANADMHRQRKET